MARFSIKGPRSGPIALKGVMYSSTIQGQQIISKWPRKRSAEFRRKNATKESRFAYLNRLFDELPQVERQVWERMGSVAPFLPRDFWVMNHYGRLFIHTRRDGRKVYPMRAMNDVSEALDAIAQDRGAILFRRGRWWEPLLPDAPPGHVLTLQNVDGNAEPRWAAPTGGSGGGAGTTPDTPPDLANFTPEITDPAIATSQVQDGGIGFVVADPPIGSVYTLLSAGTASAATEAVFRADTATKSRGSLFVGAGVYNSGTGWWHGVVSNNEDRGEAITYRLNVIQPNGDLGNNTFGYQYVGPGPNYVGYRVTGGNIEFWHGPHPSLMTKQQTMALDTNVSGFDKMAVIFRYSHFLPTPNAAHLVHYKPSFSS